MYYVYFIKMQVNLSKGVNFVVGRRKFCDQGIDWVNLVSVLDPQSGDFVRISMGFVGSPYHRHRFGFGQDLSRHSIRIAKGGHGCGDRCKVETVQLARASISLIDGLCHFDERFSIFWIQKSQLRRREESSRLVWLPFCWNDLSRQSTTRRNLNLNCCHRRAIWRSIVWEIDFRPGILERHQNKLLVQNPINLSLTSPSRAMRFFSFRTVARTFEINKCSQLYP